MGKTRFPRTIVGAGKEGLMRNTYMLGNYSKTSPWRGGEKPNVFIPHLVRLSRTRANEGDWFAAQNMNDKATNLAHQFKKLIPPEVFEEAIRWDRELFKKLLKRPFSGLGNHVTDLPALATQALLYHKNACEALLSGDPCKAVSQFFRAGSMAMTVISEIKMHHMEGEMEKPFVDRMEMLVDRAATGIKKAIKMMTCAMMLKHEGMHHGIAALGEGEETYREAWEEAMEELMDRPSSVARRPQPIWGSIHNQPLRLTADELVKARTVLKKILRAKTTSKG